MDQWGFSESRTLSPIKVNFGLLDFAEWMLDRVAGIWNSSKQVTNPGGFLPKWLEPDPTRVSNCRKANIFHTVPVDSNSQF